MTTTTNSARRASSPGALRAALAAADPAALTVEDRMALLDLFERAHAAARVERVRLFGLCDDCGAEHWRGDCQPISVE